METVRQYSSFIANKNTKKYISFNLIMFAIMLILIIFLNTVLKKHIEEELPLINKVFIGFFIFQIFLCILVSLISKLKPKSVFKKLPSNIDDIFKNGTRFKDMQNFILGDEGLLAFIDAKPIYIKYIDMQNVYVYKFIQGVFFIPIISHYFINIETLEKNYSIPIKIKMDNIKYTEQDFLDLTYSLHNKNEYITLGGLVKRNQRINVNV